jgi:hypothetical protein
MFALMIRDDFGGVRRHHVAERLAGAGICYNLATGPYSPYRQNCLPLAPQYPFANLVWN